jgi:uncharacterized protein (TIGR02172 family)
MKPIGIGRTAEIFPYEDGKVLKLFFAWCPRQWAEVEAEFTAQAFALGLPTPRIYGVTGQEGRHGIIMERVEGTSMLTRMRQHPLRAAHFGRMLAELHLQMHEKRLGGESLLRLGLRRRITSSKFLDETKKESMLAILETLSDRDSLCHMDFHPDNVLLTSAGPIIIDWSNLCQGAPAADVARSWLIMQIGEPPKGTPGLWLINLIRNRFINSYLKHYLSHSKVKLDEVKKWLLPIAAARLSEEIAGERERILCILLQK